MTTTTLKYQAIQSKLSVLRLTKINWKIVYIVISILLCIALLFYIFAINELTKGTYLIKKYNKDIEHLLQENRMLQASAADTYFLGDMEDRAREHGFERTVQIKYVQILDNHLSMIR